MGGYSSGSSGAPSGGGTDKQAKKFAKKNEPTPIKDFIQGGGVTGMVIREITKAIDPKRNKTAKGGDVYGGKTSYGYDEAKEKIDYKPQSTLANRNDNDRPTQKSLEQPKVASQMDNSAVKSDLVNADVTSPTYVEMNQDEDLLARKKRGRKLTILTSVTGDTSKPELSKKALLG